MAAIVEGREAATVDATVRNAALKLTTVLSAVENGPSSAGPWFAFEYYPPRTPEGVAKLWERLAKMASQGPAYLDFTWGAGGSTSELTMELATEAQRRFGVPSNMHLTCTNMPRETLDKAIAEAKANGIRNILALRGDPPKGQVDWKPVESGFSCALDLVKYLRSEEGDLFCISVAGYPEGHPDHILKVEEGRELSAAEQGRAVTMADGQHVCSDEDFAAELSYLKAKVDAGANIIVTQMFFDVEVYLSFVDACRAAGITVPIVPGIMCITAYGGFKRMIGFCKSRVPPHVADALEAIKDDSKAIKAYGVKFGIETCERLLAHGCKGLHFYTLNLSQVVVGILDGLKLSKPEAAPGEALSKSNDLMGTKGTMFSESFDVRCKIASGGQGSDKA